MREAIDTKIDSTREVYHEVHIKCTVRAGGGRADGHVGGECMRCCPRRKCGACGAQVCTAVVAFCRAPSPVWSSSFGGLSSYDAVSSSLSESWLRLRVAASSQLRPPM